ncbi:hypothetical protein [Ancylobacter sp.]|uniref:hypothetical protein n=1 Tax=Ancylobacter sp. TaxID=1872567 RepID=UPI003C7DD3FA
MTRPVPPACLRDAAPLRPAPMPHAVPFLLNMALAAALGGFLGGGAGALAGAVLLALLAAFVLAPALARHVARQLARHMPPLSARLARAAAPLGAVLRPLLGLVLLPPAALVTIGASLLLLVWQRTLGRLNPPQLSVIAALQRRIDALRKLLGGLLAADNLPMTAVNALLLLVLGCVLGGIQVAFYVALAAVPVLICALMMLAVESSREPEDGPASVPVSAPVSPPSVAAPALAAVSPGREAVGAETRPTNAPAMEPITAATG